MVRVWIDDIGTVACAVPIPVVIFSVAQGVGRYLFVTLHSSDGNYRGTDLDLAPYFETSWVSSVSSDNLALT